MIKQYPKNLSNIMWVFGASIITLYFFYLLFIAINNLGLEIKEDQAIVTKKSYQAPHQTYIIQNIGGRNLTLPHSIDGAYIIHLKINEQWEAYAIVSKAEYEVINIGQPLAIYYQQSRLTKTIQVLETQLKE